MIFNIRTLLCLGEMCAKTMLRLMMKNLKTHERWFNYCVSEQTIKLMEIIALCKMHFYCSRSHIDSHHMVSIAVVNSCRLINQTNLSENKHNVNGLFMSASQDSRFTNQKVNNRHERSPMGSTIGNRQVRIHPQVARFFVYPKCPN